MSNHTLQELKAELAHVKDQLQDARTAEVGQNGTLLTIADAALKHHLTENADLRDRLDAAEKERDKARAELARLTHELDVPVLASALNAEIIAALERVQAETARLREALEWYANEDRESVQDDKGSVWSRPMSNWKELVYDQSPKYAGPRFTRLTSKAAEEQSTGSKPPLSDIERVVSSFMEQMEKVIPFKGYFSSPLSIIEKDFTSIVAYMANLEVSLDEANNHIGDLEEQNSKLNEQIKNILDSED